MNEQELNKKLAEWAGFKMSISPYNDECLFYPDGSWSRDEDLDSNMLKFTQSLDACFEWLVPKLWVCQYVLDEGIFHIWMVSRPNKEGKVPPRCSALDEFNPALALCLAIEKLIDWEVKE